MDHDLASIFQGFYGDDSSGYAQLYHLNFLNDLCNLTYQPLRKFVLG